MHPQERASALNVQTKILVALNFFATGSYQHPVGLNVFLGVSQASVSRCIAEVSRALNRPDIFNQWVQFPRNMAELNRVQQQFYNKFQIPGVIGCIDCTHIAIFPPVLNHPINPEYIFVNRKGYHSINTQLICDSSLKILHVNARFPGRRI
ncbi:DDE superfamily endonuclease [Popillia japonica]|uniref:DDE superfamily endonuclease n=1 Tax=Popillia japonica TaxID=7064 RepID=A0AAW1L4W3_POPJA